MKFETGNLNELTSVHPERRGWFAGAFVPQSTLFHTDGIEIKWAHHKKGLKKTTGMDFDARIRTVVILISGVWRTTLIEENREIILSNSGDYLIYDTGEHVSEAVEDSHVVVVRWHV